MSDVGDLFGAREPEPRPAVPRNLNANQFDLARSLREQATELDVAGIPSIEGDAISFRPASVNDPDDDDPVTVTMRPRPTQADQVDVFVHRRSEMPQNPSWTETLDDIAGGSLGLSFG